MRIVLCYPVEPHQIERIQAAAPGHEIVEAGQQRISSEIFEADIFCGHAKESPIPWTEVVQRGRLKWIQSSAAGLDHCLAPAVIESEILVTSASGLFAHQVAEQTMALLLGLVRRAPLFVRAMQKREFIRRPTRDLRGSTVGIVGFGGNGRRIAEVLAPWGVRIIATDMFPGEKPAHVAELWPAEWLHQLLPLVDVLVLCVPLNANTRGMIGAQEFNLLKPGAILINVARGKVVVESEMVAALESGRLWGAGLDVTEVEPLSEESRLWDMPNVFITPHVGAQSASRYEDATRLVCENLKRYLNGRPMLNLVDKRLGFPIPNGRLPPALGCVERYSS